MTALVRNILTPERLIPLSFLALILAGTCLLLLPIATHAPISPIDAFFTATSATCVTGLVVVDTGSVFTGFGQAVILALIQLGGLGIMTLSIAFLYMVAGRVSLFNREVLEMSVFQGPMKGLLPLLLHVLRITLWIEAAGALLLTWRFHQCMPLGDALYSGVFHSISGFCNAGFSLYPDSMSAWREDPLTNGILMALIVLGGLGFLVLSELWSWWRSGRQQPLSLTARLVVFTSIGLIVFGALGVLASEWHNVLDIRDWSDLPGALLESLFLSVSSRTAGFNTLPMDGLTEPTYLGLVLLMLVGASPASCGGGIKTTTLIVLLAHLRSRFLDQRDTVIGNRRIPESIVSRSVSITIFSLLVVMAGTLLLLSTEGQGVALKEGSLVVNSSQGGGTKDTWVLQEEEGSTPC